MSDWTAGYRADIDYTYGYYSEINPLRIKLAFLQSGLRCPEIGTACELGFGQGLAVNFHATASVTQWYGTDFNPSQAAFARGLASATNADVRLYDEAFSEFSKRVDLPDFDYIALHGIWSWISDENRKAIIEFINKKLRVGGVLYISYNTMPGWASFAPVRHILKEHSRVFGTKNSGVINHINDAINYSEELIEKNPLFIRANPLVSNRINVMKQDNKNYLAHEFFNDHWEPMYFSVMNDWLQQAKLDYACSANYLDHIDAININTEQQSFLKKIKDPIFYQTVRDYMVNQSFRKDYWIKGAQQLSALEQVESLREIKVVLTTPPDYVKFKVSGALGELTLAENLIKPLLELMSNYGSHRIIDLEYELAKSGINFSQLIDSLMILVGLGHVNPIQENDVIKKIKLQTDSLNENILNRARFDAKINYLVSPATGGGISVGRIAQLFLLAMKSGTDVRSEDLSQYAWRILSSQAQKLIKQGQTLETMEENLNELHEQAEDFLKLQLPILKALHIAD